MKKIVPKLIRDKYCSVTNYNVGTVVFLAIFNSPSFALKQKTSVKTDDILILTFSSAFVVCQREGCIVYC